MNAAIKWMMEKATVETLEDGTISYFFSGNIPASMKRQIIAASTRNSSTPKSTTYNNSGDVFDWSATFGATNSTQYHVRFTYNDYTVPAMA